MRIARNCLETKCLALLVVLFLGAFTAGVSARSAGPVAARTGDFGEQNCTACHTGNSLNAAGGTFTISGVPAIYTPGNVYTITVSIQKSGQARWGFQLAVRAVSNSQQAGTLAAKDGNTQILTGSGIQYIQQTTAGTFAGTNSGTWTFEWTAPSPAVGAVRFGAAGNAANNNNANSGDFIYTATVTSNAPVVAKPTTALFPHFSVGQGYTTTFTLVNTGTTAVDGNLIFTGQDGNAMDVGLVTPSGLALQPAHEAVLANSTAVAIPAGGTKFITVYPVKAADALKSGWARLESTGGAPSGVATFQYAPGGKLSGIAGVMASDLYENAMIPVDDDVAGGRMTGFAVANTGTDAIVVRVVAFKEDGTAGPAMQSISLTAGQQRARFVFEEPAAGQNFKGSIVLSGQNTKKFGAVALVLNQGLYTAIPVIPTKAPQ